MSFEFSYFQDRPHVPIALEYGSKRVRFLPLLDSGADHSVFYQADALRLGLPWDEGVCKELENADGSIFQARVFELLLDIEGYRFPIEIYFVEGEASSIPLLGRKDFFEKFDIVFRESQQRLMLQPLSV